MKHKTGIYVSGGFVAKAFKGRLPKDLPVYPLDTLQLGYVKSEDSYWLEYVPHTAFWMGRWFEIPKAVGQRLMRSWEALKT